MTMTYTRLTEDQRYQIYDGVTESLSHRKIASLINKHHSAVSREVKRNRGLDLKPQEKAQERHKSKPRHIKLTPEVQSLIVENIQHEWSPDQIRGRLRSKGFPMVCAVTTYNYIQQDKALVGQLYQHLRHKTYKKRTGSPDARSQIIGRIPIDERPSIVNKKVRLGDWEADTIIGKVSSRGLGHIGRTCQSMNG